MSRISVAIITYNAGDLIGQCLDSVSWTDEVIVVDGMSSDDTVVVCRRYPNTTVITAPNTPNFDVNKNIAIENCTGDWILVLDADEVVTDELARELRQAASENSHAGYFLPRRNFFLGRWLRHGGWYPDHTLRFFRRGRGRFPCLHVHERLELDGATGFLDGEILHYTYRTFREYFDKMDRYTSFEAEYIHSITIGQDGTGLHDFLRNPEKRKPYLRKLWWKYVPFKPFFRFGLIYVVRGGFLDGRHGFTLAFLSAVSDYVSIQKFRNRSEEEGEKKGV